MAECNSWTTIAPTWSPGVCRQNRELEGIDDLFADGHRELCLTDVEPLADGRIVDFSLLFKPEATGARDVGCILRVYDEGLWTRTAVEDRYLIEDRMARCELVREVRSLLRARRGIGLDRELKIGGRACRWYRTGGRDTAASAFGASAAAPKKGIAAAVIPSASLRRPRDLRSPIHWAPPQPATFLLVLHATAISPRVPRSPNGSLTLGQCEREGERRLVSRAAGCSGRSRDRQAQRSPTDEPSL